MKAYLVTTGILFALIAVLHIWRIIAEWNGFDAEFCFVADVGALALALSAWPGSCLPLAVAVSHRHIVVS